MMVTGREYRQLVDVCCFECDRKAKLLQKTYEFLKWCSYLDCRVFLCPTCKPDHEIMHQLAGDTHESNKRRRYND